MAVKASVTITISKLRDTDIITRYYKLQASTASAPAKPTTLIPSGWTDTEPSYTSGSTNTLYFVDEYIFSDGTFQYTEVSKSTSYEAAKEAYNKAENAQDVANNASPKIYHICLSPSGVTPIAGYIRFARCTIKSSYVNQSITFDASLRSIGHTIVEIQFTNVNNSDPTLRIFKVNGKARVYAIKVDTSIWDFYIRKADDYESATFTDFKCRKFNLC